MLKSTHDDGGVGGTGLARRAAWKMNNGGEIGMEKPDADNWGLCLVWPNVFDR